MSELRQWVMEASAKPEVVAAVGRVYADLQTRIDARRPLCVMSGRCCHFEDFGHRLYVTTIELAAFVAELKGVVGERREGGCAFQKGKVCRVHAIRPMGCRIFFCDSTAQEWQKEVYEEFHGRFKELHSELSIPYAYVEWRFACGELGLDGDSKADAGPEAVVRAKSF
jgi:Fe-S-cluster containining protein